MRVGGAPVEVWTDSGRKFFVSGHPHVLVRIEAGHNPTLAYYP